MRRAIRVGLLVLVSPALLLALLVGAAFVVAGLVGVLFSRLRGRPIRAARPSKSEPLAVTGPATGGGG